MELLYVAITGTSHYFGTDFLKPGQVIQLCMDPDNPYDQEAIRAEIHPIGKIGYVANSTHTVPKGCRSAGRIYDSFDLQLSGIEWEELAEREQLYMNAEKERLLYVAATL